MTTHVDDGPTRGVRGWRIQRMLPDAIRGAGAFRQGARGAGVHPRWAGAGDAGSAPASEGVVSVFVLARRAACLSGAEAVVWGLLFANGVVALAGCLGIWLRPG